MKTCEIPLGYFKQGDDLAGLLEKADSPQHAFRLHAMLMQEVGFDLDRIAEKVGKYPQDQITVNADTHMISLEGPDELVDELVESDLAVLPVEDEEEK